jgi:hypothetical protein
MRYALPVLLWLLNISGFAFAFDDFSVCGALTRSGGTGLYLAYPTFSSAIAKFQGKPTCDSSGSFCFTPVGGTNVFDDNARFYFVPAPIPRSEEGVWHIRTQTRAKNLTGADRAFLSRPNVTTRCSPNAPLGPFPKGPFVDVNDYVEHHGSPDDYRPNIYLHRYFHFQIQDTPSSKCIFTDDRKIFKDLKSIYGYDDVDTSPNQVVNLFGVTTRAVAATAYAGLSSEFAYRDSPEPACFGFTVPVPTRSEYLGEKIDWKPYLTTIWIKKLRGRQIVPEVMARSVQWRQ